MPRRKEKKHRTRRRQGQNVCGVWNKTEKEKQTCKEGLVLSVEGMKMPENEV